MHDAEKTTGGCLCGAIHYEAEAYLKDAYYCHCRMCQRSSGGAAEIAVFVKPGTLEFLKKEPKYFPSSPFGLRGFCPHCGSRLIWMSPAKPDWTNLAIGCLDHPEQVVPCEHIGVESQLPWYMIDDGLPRKHTYDDPEVVGAWAHAGKTHDGEEL